ncbi:coiled coil domain-containing protein [Leucothrix arctica]|uniref:Coiled coil domain-containing protein n=1 Tax=Leucothrix arctica TaxID=1481894 RepID=A0A317CJI7_9GAMM|nr:coiled coil domain-containing protein [Leucothrix arctica]PWQ98387.1 coiled coil domain-containing protein [Leucothrix arctica]
MDTQDKHVEKMQAKLDQVDAKIDLWQAKAKEASADSQIEYEKKVEELKSERNEAAEWLDKVADASDDAWDSIKDGFEDAYEKIKKALS